jgi:hypothetical protein
MEEEEEGRLGFRREVSTRQGGSLENKFYREQARSCPHVL